MPDHARFFLTLSNSRIWLASFLLCLLIPSGCRTRRLESASQIKERSQTHVLLRDAKGNLWTRHVVAVMGYNHLSPRAAAGYSRLEFVRADRNPRDPEDVDAELLRRPARSVNELSFVDDRLSVLQRFSIGDDVGQRPYILSGTHDLYFVGCLIKQNSSAALADVISVSTLPQTSGLSGTGGFSTKVNIPISDARWIWELIPSINPSDFANQYGTRRFLGFNERINNMDYAGKESVRKMFSSYLGADSFARLSLSQPNPAEEIMVNGDIQIGQDGAQDYVCRILLGPVDTFENYLTFGLEELIRDEAMIADLEAIDFHYANGPELFARASASWLGRNWLTMGTVGLTGLTYFSSGSTVAAVPIFVQRMSETAGLTNSVMVTANSVISEGLQARNARLEEERIRRREMLRVVIPESVRPLALSEGLNTALQMAALHSYAGYIASLLHEDANRKPDSRMWPKSVLADNNGQIISADAVASYVRAYDGAAAAYQAMDRGQNPDRAQRSWETINQAVLRFTTAYPATANALMNQSLVAKFNSISIGSETTLASFENLLGMQISTTDQRQKLKNAYMTENIFNIYRQLQARSRRGTILSPEHVFMMTGPHPLRVESPEVQRKIASYRTLLMKLLGGKELDSHDERVESRLLFAALSDPERSHDSSFEELKSLHWRDRVAAVDAARGFLKSSGAPKGSQSATMTCDDSSRECVDFQLFSKKAKVFSQALESLDGLSQLSNRARSCAIQMQRSLCASLASILDNLGSLYQEIKGECKSLQSYSRGRVACTRVATLEAFEVIEMQCLQAGLTNSQCLKWLKENLVLSGEEGYWPAGGGFGYQTADMIREVERIRALEGGQLDPNDLNRIERMRIYFSQSR